MRPRRRLANLVACGLLACVGPRPAAACCMVPERWDGDVDQAEQNVVVVHHAGHEELVLRVRPFFQAKTGRPLPDGASTTPAYLEWVVTVPSPPTGYRTVPATIFEDADALADRLTRLAAAQDAARSQWVWPQWLTDVYTLGRDAATATAERWSDDLEVERPVTVGPYEITAVRARGREALEELNRYLAGRGYPQEDAAHMAWFVDRGFTFLCIHVTPPPGDGTLGRRLDLVPLQIGFETPRPYYPAKFSSRQGSFALSLATLTSRPIARASRRDVGGRLAARVPAHGNPWTVKPLPAALADATTGAWAAGVERWHVNAFRSDGFNPVGPDGRPAIASWTDDVFFDLGGDDDDMPGWYYGDREIGAVDRFAREHWIALVVVLLAGLGTAGAILRRRERGRARRQAREAARAARVGGGDRR